MKKLQDKRLKSKTNKGERTQQKLKDIATQLFEEDSFDKVSVDDIVKAAGVSKGTFYIYYDSKDTLIADILVDYVKNIDTDYKNHLDKIPPDTPADEMILSLVANISEVLVEKIGHSNMSSIYRLQLDKRIDTDSVKGYNRSLYQMFRDIIALGLNQGIFQTKIPLQNITHHFVMAIRGISYEWCIRYPDFDLKEQALTHFQMLLRGLS